MGGDLSKNVVNVATKILTNVAITSTNNCQIKIDSEQEIEVIGSSNVTFSGDTFNDTIVVLQDCLQTSKTEDQVTTNVKNVASQIAKTIDRAFEIPRGSRKSENIINIMNELATNITDKFNQKCNTNLKSDQKVRVVDSNNIVFFNDKWNLNVDNTQSCIQQNTAIVGIQTQLSNQISQTASTEVKSLLGGLILIVVIILIIGGGLILGGEKALTSWKLWLVVILAVALYLVLAYFVGLWPFDKKKKSKHDDKGNEVYQ